MYVSKKPPLSRAKPHSFGERSERAGFIASFGALRNTDNAHQVQDIEALLDRPPQRIVDSGSAPQLERKKDRGARRHVDHQSGSRSNSRGGKRPEFQVESSGLICKAGSNEMQQHRLNQSAGHRFSILRKPVDGLHAAIPAWLLELGKHQRPFGGKTENCSQASRPEPTVHRDLQIAFQPRRPRGPISSNCGRVAFSRSKGRAMPRFPARP